MKHPLLFSAIVLSSLPAFATTWPVGPTRTYTKPSQVSTMVQNGDTVNIDAGTYASDVAYWSASNLVLRGVNGMARLASSGQVYGGKAIWVIGGNNTTVEYVEFSDAACVDNNGAGIRQEGHNLTVRHCYFHHNQDGILAGTVSPSHIRIEYTEFAYNGAGDGQSHNLYINNVDTLTFRYNYSHHAAVGHELKSRAKVNFILYNRISDEATGTASRSVDLPNGGTAYLTGNVIEQGPQSQNSNVVGFGMEGLTNPAPHRLYAVNNTVVNNRSTGSFFQFNAAIALFKAYDNIIAGTGTFISGTLPTAIDTASNRIKTDIASFQFANAAGYDYQLTSNSLTALNNGVSPGTANGISLSPVMHYVHPAGASPRCVSGNPDIGAYELCAATAPLAFSFSVSDTVSCPSNPCTADVNLTVSGGSPPYSYNWSNGATTEDLLNKCSGTYGVTVTDAGGSSATGTRSINNVTACGAPGTPVVSNIASSSAQVSWTGNGCAVKYRVQLKNTSTAGITTQYVTAPATSCGFTGLASNTTYQVKVRTECTASGTSVSVWSATVSFTTLGTVASPCVAPSNITAAATSNTAANVSWTPVSGANGYQLRYRVTGTTTWTLVTISSGSTNSKSLAALQPNASYQVQLRTKCTVNPITWSSYSGTVTFNTPMRMEEAELPNVLVYPNPSHGVVNFELGDVTGTLVICNVAGHEVVRRVVDAGGNVVTMALLPKGLLAYRFTGADGRLQMGVFVVVN